MTHMYELDIKPRRMAAHGNYPVWFASNSKLWPRVPYQTYWDAAVVWQEWLKTLPLFVGYDNYEHGGGENIIYVKDDRDLAIIKLAFDSKLFE